MCTTCGCGGDEGATLRDLQTGEVRALEGASTGEHGPLHVHRDGHAHAPRHAHAHAHVHGHPHPHPHEHPHEHDHDHEHPHGHQHEHPHRHDDAPRGTTVSLEARVLAKNDALAATNRAWFSGREILALNLVSSPGAGKTTLLERTIRDLQKDLLLHVVEGDQATARDGERIRAAGAPAVQVNTGAGCHLDADMVARGLDVLKPPVGAVVFIENVGNLVCPALFDLGERSKVAILSVTEGDDKPIKYPHMFRAADLLILNKIDLLPHVDFDVAAAIAHAKSVNPRLEILQLSARTEEGLDAWYAWLRAAHRRAVEARGGRI